MRSRIAVDAGSEVGCEELDEGGFGRPALDADHGNVDARLGDALAGAVEVLADRIRRVVRGEHQTHDRCCAVGGDVPRGVLDLRVGVLQAERHLEAAGFGGIECSLQGVGLRFGELRKG